MNLELGMKYFARSTHRSFMQVSRVCFGLPYRVREFKIVTLDPGYGASGPYAKRAGYDAIAAAEAGLLHITGEKDGPPTRPGLGLTDMSTGLYLHGAIMAALFARQKTGKGQKIDASLFESQVALLSNVAMSWLNAGELAHRWGTQHPSIVPYQAFKTKDSYLVLGATNNRQFQVLSKLLDRADLATDGRFEDNGTRLKNREELTTMMNKILASKTTDEWMERLEGSGMPYGPINTVDRVFSHPQTIARNMVQTVPYDAIASGELKLLGELSKFHNISLGCLINVKFSESCEIQRNVTASSACAAEAW